MVAMGVKSPGTSRYFLLRRSKSLFLARRLARWFCLAILIGGCVVYAVIAMVPLLLKRINPEYAALKQLDHLDFASVAKELGYPLPESPAQDLRAVREQLLKQENWLMIVI